MRYRILVIFTFLFTIRANSASLTKECVDWINNISGTSQAIKVNKNQVFLALKGYAPKRSQAPGETMFQFSGDKAKLAPRQPYIVRVSTNETSFSVESEFANGSMEKISFNNSKEKGCYPDLQTYKVKSGVYVKRSFEICQAFVTMDSENKKIDHCFTKSPLPVTLETCVGDLKDKLEEIGNKGVKMELQIAGIKHTEVAMDDPVGTSGLSNLERAKIYYQKCIDHNSIGGLRDNIYEHFPNNFPLPVKPANESLKSGTM